MPISSRDVIRGLEAAGWRGAPDWRQSGVRLRKD
jgi:hypothetical protein